MILKFRFVWYIIFYLRSKLQLGSIFLYSSLHTAKQKSRSLKCSGASLFARVHRENSRRRSNPLAQSRASGDLRSLDGVFSAHLKAFRSFGRPYHYLSSFFSTFCKFVLIQKTNLVIILFVLLVF